MESNDMGLSGEIIGVIVGAVLAGSIGIFTVYFSKFLVSLFVPDS
jgi:hypothetical protein